MCPYLTYKLHVTGKKVDLRKKLWSSVRDGKPMYRLEHVAAARKAVFSGRVGAMDVGFRQA